MGLIVKVGGQADLPPKPEKWPECGNYEFQETDNGQDIF